MTTKRARLIVLAMLIAIAAILIVGWYVPDVSADTIGPPTVETYLQNISANMSIIQWMVGTVGTLLGLLIGSLGYAYKRDIKSVNEKADKALEKTDIIEKDFLSIDSFKLAMAGRDKH